MKKTYFLIASWIITLLFTGCGTAGDTFHNPSESLAAKCLVAVMEAETTEEVNDYLTSDSQNLASLFVLGFPGDDYKVDVTYCGSYEDYDVFYYEARISGNRVPMDSDYVLLQRDGNRYRICNDPVKLLNMAQHFLCDSCGGLGMHMTGDFDICNTCNGTGMIFH